jgi:hypothetical protein
MQSNSTSVQQQAGGVEQQAPTVEPWAASEEQQATKEQQAAKAAGRQSTAKGEEVRRRRASATSQLDNQFTQNVTIEMYSEWQLLQLFPPTEES